MAASIRAHPSCLPAQKVHSILLLPASTFRLQSWHWRVRKSLQSALKSGSVVSGLLLRVHQRALQRVPVSVLFLTTQVEVQARSPVRSHANYDDLRGELNEKVSSPGNDREMAGLVGLRESYSRLVRKSRPKRDI